MHRWSLESNLVNNHDLKQLEICAPRSVTSVFGKLREKEVTCSGRVGGHTEGFVEKGRDSPGAAAASTLQQREQMTKCMAVERTRACFVHIQV